MLFFAVTIAGCSSEDTNVVGEDVSGDSFTYTLDAQTVPVTDIVAQKSEDWIGVSGRSADGRVIEVQFNKYGNFKGVSTYSILEDSNVPDRDSYHYYKSNYFDFELVSIDEVAKRVSVTFSGKLYDDQYDITSDFSVVDGSFTVAYTDVAPQVSGLKVEAKINGNQWYATETEEQTGGFFTGENVTLYASNDSQYTLSTTINHETTEVGTYTFTNSSANNKVGLSIYETATLQDITFPTTSGTLKITEKTVGAQFTIISGTFSLTAFNPFTQGTITVSDGTFKRVYLNY